MINLLNLGLIPLIPKGFSRVKEGVNLEGRRFTLTPHHAILILTNAFFSPTNAYKVLFHNFALMSCNLSLIYLRGYYNDVFHQKVISMKDRFMVLKILSIQSSDPPERTSHTFLSCLLTPVRIPWSF